MAKIIFPWKKYFIVQENLQVRIYAIQKIIIQITNKMKELILIIFKSTNIKKIY